MKKERSIRAPESTDRIAVIGRTGSGKTQASLFWLSRQNIDNMPWVVIDFKLDQTIGKIKKARHMENYSKLPNSPGIHVLHPTMDDLDELDDYLVRIHEHEDIGLFVDEGMVLKDSIPFQNILIQGRSKHIPAIVCTQRPVGISRFVFSEADFFQVFNLNDRRDKKTVTDFASKITFDRRLPDYHSFYLDVKRDQMDILKPVPSESEILASIDDKIVSHRSWI
jgi:hypothetical protein